MRILVLNGSPRPEKSNTIKLTKAFLEGLSYKPERNIHNIETVNIADKHIEPCQGCYCCWEKTPGKCVINDDTQELLLKYREAELVVWSFPLYCFGMPSKTKTFIDRLLPLFLPVIRESADGKPGHPSRYDLSEQKHVLISTCGFYTAEKNYDALIKQFDILFAGKSEKILCPQGELFRIPALQARTDEYLEIVKQAGEEYFTGGVITEKTTKQLTIPLYPKETFLEMANTSWKIAETNSESENLAQVNQPQGKMQISPCERLLRQMAAIYEPLSNAPKGEKHIEFFFTDLGETYQIWVKGNEAEFIKDKKAFVPFSVKIETPFDVWQNISIGKASGTEALFRHKYRVLGDFSLMTTLLFGFSVRKKVQAPEEKRSKKRSMMIFLAPFLSLWVLLPILGNTGAYITVMVSACVPLMTMFFKLSTYDCVAAFAASALSIAYLAGISGEIIITLSYAFFGVMWLISIFCRIPLCAWYSARNYGGDDVFSNPLFLRTNRIVAGLWGILYFASCLGIWLLLPNAFSPYIGLISSITSSLAGIFTAIFVNWYPAHYARGKIETDTH